MLNTKLKKLLTALTVVSALLFATSVHANVGKVVYGYGDNYALDSDGNRRDLRKGAEVREGDTLVTGRGRMHIRLIDGGYISVYPNSEYMINKFKYSGKKYNNTPAKSEKEAEAGKKDSGIFSLLKGAARQITGLLGRTHNKNFKFKTSIATIGIRGTGFFARLCQADCFDADGNPMQDGMYVKNNTGVITMTTSVGDVALAQGQSAFAASNADKPQQTTQPPVAYNIVTPDIQLFDFDEKILDVDQEIGVGIGAPVDPPVTLPPVVTNLEYVTSDDLIFPAVFGGVDTAKTSDSVQQVDERINHFQGLGVYGDAGVLIFDKGSAVLEEAGVDVTLGVLWNRWSSGYTFTEDGINVPQGTQAGNDIHIIGSDNITPNLAGLTGRGTVNYVSTGGTNPTISGFAATQTGTQTINASINYATAEVTNFQLDVSFGATTMSTNLITLSPLSGTSGNTVSLAGSCSGPECGGNGLSVNGEASINMVGPNAEGIYGVYNLTNLENAVSGSYVAAE